MVDDKRINGSGRRTTDDYCPMQTDDYCPMHGSVVEAQENIEAGFKWLILLHVGEYLMIIGGMGAFILFLLRRGI